jgi:peptidoglycan biosynthesis protein MviN/MurJ (putative lipid II flippase)
LTEPETPKWKTGTLWGVLCVFLVLGSVGLATIAYGILGILDGQWWTLVAFPIGAAMAVLSFLFMAGILYRVDRYRGIEGRRVALFE